MATSNDVIKSFSIQVNTDNGKIKIDGLTKSFVGADKALAKMNKTVKEMPKAIPAMGNAVGSAGKKMDDYKEATGGANAVTMEFGRVISDAPYGIRGMANNISQLTSQFFQMSTKTDKAGKRIGSFGGSLKAIGGTLLGPLGILIGFQAVIAAVDYFGGAMKKSTDILKEFNGAAAQGGSALKIFKQQVQSGNVSNEELTRTLKAVNSEYADLNVAVDDNGKLTDDAVEAIDRKVAALERVARASALQSVIEKELAAVYEMDIELMDARTKRRQKFSDDEVAAAKRRATENMANNLDFSGSIYGGNFANSNLSGREEEAYDSTKDERIIETRIAAANDKVEDIMKLFGDNDLLDEMFGLSKTGGSSRALKVFKQRFLNLQSIINSNNKDIQTDATDNQVKLLEIDKKYSLRAVDNKLEEFRLKEEARLKAYLKSIEGTDKEEEMKRKAKADSLASIEDAESQHGEAVIAIRDNFAQKIIKKEIEIAEAINKIKADNAVTIAMNYDSSGDEDLFNLQEGIIAEANKAKKDSLQEALDNAVDGDNPEEILSAQIELDNFESELLAGKENRELDHFNKLTAIRQEYIGFLRTTGSILKNLAGDNESMQRAALLINKGAASADVVVKAQAANVAHDAAYANRGITAITTTQKLANSAKLVKDKARTNLGAGLAIANIWSAGFGSKSVPGGSSGGAGGGRTFDFNLVGSTGQNQLAQATAGQLDQPVQAYVVSSQITNSQQLESQVQSDATFGG